MEKQSFRGSSMLTGTTQIRHKQLFDQIRGFNAQHLSVGSIVLSTCLLIGPFCSCDYRIITEIYIVKGEIGGQVWCFKSPSRLWSQNQQFSGLSAIRSLSDSPSGRSKFKYLAFTPSCCVKKYKPFGLFLLYKSRACECTSSRGSRALTCLPPEGHNWPQKIWAWMVCLDAADLSHNFQWGSCHRETEHGTSIILASYSKTHLLGSSAAVEFDFCWDHFGRFIVGR